MLEVAANVKLKMRKTTNPFLKSNARIRMRTILAADPNYNIFKLLFAQFKIGMHLWISALIFEATRVHEIAHLPKGHANPTSREME